MAGNHQALADLSPSQLELLRIRLTRSAPRDPGAPIVRMSREADTSVLSFAQQRMWFVSRLAPESAAYNVTHGVRLRGRLSSPVIEQSFNEVVRRHEVLRTTFSSERGEPAQSIAARLALRPRLVDLRGLSGVESEQVGRLADEEARRPFDLNRGPLLRVTILWMGQREHVMLVSMHHIISDFWSLGVLTREIAALYGAFSAGDASTIPELEIQYRDYAEWQRNSLREHALDGQLSYWLRQLGGRLPPLDLPTDGPLSPGHSLEGATRSLQIPRDLYDSIRAFSRDRGCTVTMTLLAAFKVLLHRLSGQDDLIVGMTIANRNRSELEPLIGFFVNTLAMRTDVSGDPVFTELLSRVRDNCLEAYGHQDVPFERIVEELQPERKLNRHPVFDILFNSLTVRLEGMRLNDVTLSSLDRLDPESKFALTLNVEEFGNELGFRAVYQSGLFSAKRIEFLLDQYKHLLDQIVAAPDSPISSYSLVTEAQRHLLPDATVSLTGPDYEPVTALIHRWAERTAGNAAVSQGGRTWSYGELAERASMLAHSLRDRGVTSRDAVAVMGPRSFGLIAGYVGVLTSGAVLLPVERHLPPQRKRLMISEADARWVLCIGAPPDEPWRAEYSSTLLTLDKDTGRIVDTAGLGNNRVHQLGEPGPADPAYIFFTSGTTAAPKAVLGCHNGLSHFLEWQRQEFGVVPEDRCAQLTGHSFDVMLRDVFLPLTSGARLCLPPDDYMTGGDTLSWLEREKITLLHCVPALAQRWLSNATAEVSLGRLRWVFFAGEPLTDALVRRWRETFSPATRIVNLYGPTETTLAKSFYRVPPEVRPGVQPLGAPIPQTQLLVLSVDKRLCGVGEPGQIAVRTPYRSLGYLNAPAENASRFIENPFRPDEQDLVYLTGDLGRYAPDGSLEILGRLDHQIKIRGVRIEPDEVNALLSKHPAVAASAVIGVSGELGDGKLTAYVVLAGGRQASVDELRTHLGKQLPLAMVPSAFVFLDELPLTPNGKVDRHALMCLNGESFAPERSFVPARTPVEEELKSIWSDVLAVDPVGVEDNFFDLGGHSLLATQVMSRILDRFHLDMPLYMLFEHPTVAALAEQVEAYALTEQRSGRRRVLAGPSSGAVHEGTQDSTVRIDQLSDDEVDKLLIEMLGKEGFQSAELAE